MDTIEPIYIAEERKSGICEYSLKNISLEEYCKSQIKRTEWFINVLSTNSISNEEEIKIQTFKELDIFGYAYIGKLKVHKYLFKLLYWLKLIKL